MGFINEYASDNDIEKYDLKSVWDKYHPTSKGQYYLGHKPMLTIDREKNIFLLPIEQGREEHGNRTTMLLWIDENHVLAEIDLVRGLNPDGIESNPYRIVWELADVHPQKGFHLPRKTIIEILKNALSVFGFDGANRQLPNTLVEFRF